MAAEARPANAPEDLQGHLVSRCGVLCDTCPAYRQGACPGCPHLEAGECAIRDCADRLAAGRCWECPQDSCYHFEALAARREAMRWLTRRRRLWTMREGPAAAPLQPAAGAGGPGGGGSLPCSGCAGCALRCGVRTGPAAG